MPVLVHMNYLKEEYRPKSDDPKYWNSWTKEKPKLNWKAVVDNWLANER